MFSWVATLYTLHDLPKRMSEKSSLNNTNTQWGARPEILLGRAEVFAPQLRGYLRRLLIIMEKFLNGYP
jgi:hypothetical protein